MGATTQKNLFDEVYKVFGHDAENNLMMDWSGYVKKIDGKNYYVWAELMPYVDSARIPYWTWNKSFFDQTSYDGYLPTGMSEFYFSMRPISYIDHTGVFLKGLRGNISQVGNLKNLNFTNRSDSDFRSAAIVHFFDAATSRYKTVVVPILENLFKVRYNVFSCDETENLQENFLSWNKAVRDTAKALADQYNYAVTIQQLPGFGRLKDSYQQQVLSLKNDAAQKIEELLSNPYVYGKKCAECAKNATIGAIPLVVIIIALALTAFTAVAWKIIDTIKNLNTQKLQAQRAVDALKQYRDVLTDKNLSQSDKEQYFKITSGVVENANEATSNATNPGPGFFDRIENILFLAGGFLILNNVTKKG